MKILAIDTSSQACSAALLIDQQVVEQFEIAPRAHTKKILPMMEQVLAMGELTLSQLDALAFACGPGSFTGIRVAASVIQGVGIATDLPIAPVSTLATIAHQVFRQTQRMSIAVAIDARMNQVYWGQYHIEKLGHIDCISEDKLGDPEPMSRQKFSADIAVGDGWRIYASRFSSHNLDVNDQFDHPHAQDVCLIAATDLANGGGIAVEKAIPVYCRNNVVQTG